MTVQTLSYADDTPQPKVNGGKSMKFTFQPESKPLPGYTIKRAIHRGGFGEVYYALTDAGKEVALKLLRQHFDVELRGVTQCLNLKHPNLVTIFDIKNDSEGDYWIIMEYVAGKSLSQVLDGYPDGMPIDDVRKWLAGLVEGLSFLHDRGIVHRDLKPGNVFVESGVVKIGDVGLSKFISESHRSAQTQSVGTVYYMAPEVAHGRYGREVDVYSLGIVLYELISGRVPFVGESAGEILMKHLSEKPDLSPIPRRLRPVLAAALEKDPLRRTPNVRQLLEDFNKAVVGFDMPQEIPEESFLNATVADSSTINRERPAGPAVSPRMVEPAQSQGHHCRRRRQSDGSGREGRPSSQGNGGRSLSRLERPSPSCQPYREENGPLESHAKALSRCPGKLLGLGRRTKTNAAADATSRTHASAAEHPGSTPEIARLAETGAHRIDRPGIYSDSERLWRSPASSLEHCAGDHGCRLGLSSLTG